MSKVSGEGVLAWMDQARAALELPSSPANVDLFDALLSPIYSAVLAAARGEMTESTSWKDEIKRQLFELRRELRIAQDARGATSTPIDVLFVPRTKSHVDQQLPVANALVRTGATVAFHSPTRAIRARIKTAGMTVAFAPWDRWGGGVITQLAGSIRALRPSKNSARLKIPAPGVEGSQVDGRALLAITLQEIRAQSPIVFTVAATIRALLRSLRPRVVVVGNDLTTEGRTTCLVARAQGTPTVCIAHGLGVANPRLARTLADRVLVYGSLQQDALRSYGLGEDRVVITGAPYLDEIPAQGGTLDPAIANALGLDDRPYVLVATSGAGQKVSLDHHRAMIRAFDQAARALPELQFVAKLHPKDRRDLYPEPSSLKVIDRSQIGDLPKSIFSWLQGAHAVVTSGSAVAMEAMLLEVPVVTMDLANELGHVDFITAGATHHATSEAALIDTLRSLKGGAARQGPGAEDYLQAKFFRAPPETASERAAAAILDAAVA
ncbi:MAG: UDP-N-acetylglucosamine 2-epimerase [Myxococcota bacterium]